MGYKVNKPKLSKLLIDANLVMGAHDITLGAAQTVDTKDVSALISLTKACISGYHIGKVVSDNNRHADNTEHAGTHTTYAKQSTFTFTNGIKGTLRINFEMKMVAGTTSMQAFLTKNGVIPGGGSDLGVEQSTSSTSYVNKTQDLAVDLAAGETIDLWSKQIGGSPGGNFVDTFHIDYDNEDIVTV